MVRGWPAIPSVRRCPPPGWPRPGGEAAACPRSFCPRSFCPRSFCPRSFCPGASSRCPDGWLVRLVAVAPSGGTQIGERLDRRRRRRESVGLRRGQPVIGQRVPGAVVLPRAVGLVDGVGRHTAVTAAGRTRTFGLVVRHRRIGRHGRVAVSGVPGLPRLRDVRGLPAAQAVCARAGAGAGHGGLARLIVPRARARGRRTGVRWTGVRGTAAGRGIRLTGPAQVTSAGRRPVGRRSLRVDRGERVGAGRQERLEVSSWLSSACSPAADAALSGLSGLPLSAPGFPCSACIAGAPAGISAGVPSGAPAGVSRSSVATGRSPGSQRWEMSALPGRVCCLQRKPRLRTSVAIEHRLP